jgi:UDPglucose 6-dehydrogenase
VGAKVHVHDPVAMDNVKKEFGERITFCGHHYEALDGADALAIVTEWNEYRTPDFGYIRHKLKQPVIFDGRNLYDPAKMAREGFTYNGIGLSAKPQ